MQSGHHYGYLDSKGAVINPGAARVIAEAVLNLKRTKWDADAGRVFKLTDAVGRVHEFEDKADYEYYKKKLAPVPEDVVLKHKRSRGARKGDLDPYDFALVAPAAAMGEIDGEDGHAAVAPATIGELPTLVYAEPLMQVYGPPTTQVGLPPGIPIPPRPIGLAEAENHMALRNMEYEPMQAIRDRAIVNRLEFAPIPVDNPQPQPPVVNPAALPPPGADIPAPVIVRVEAGAPLPRIDEIREDVRAPGVVGHVVGAIAAAAAAGDDHLLPGIEELHQAPIQARGDAPPFTMKKITHPTPAEADEHLLPGIEEIHQAPFQPRQADPGFSTKATVSTLHPRRFNMYRDKIEDLKHSAVNATRTGREEEALRILADVGKAEQSLREMGQLELRNPSTSQFLSIDEAKDLHDVLEAKQAALKLRYDATKDTAERGRLGRELRGVTSDTQYLLQAIEGNEARHEIEDAYPGPMVLDAMPAIQDNPILRFGSVMPSHAAAAVSAPPTFKASSKKSKDLFGKSKAINDSIRQEAVARKRAYEAELRRSEQYMAGPPPATPHASVSGESPVLPAASAPAVPERSAPINGASVAEAAAVEPAAQPSPALNAVVPPNNDFATTSQLESMADEVDDQEEEEHLDPAPTLGSLMRTKSGSIASLPSLSGPMSKVHLRSQAGASVGEPPAAPVAGDRLETLSGPPTPWYGAREGSASDELVMRQQSLPNTNVVPVSSALQSSQAVFNFLRSGAQSLGSTLVGAARTLSTAGVGAARTLTTAGANALASTPVAVSDSPAATQPTVQRQGTSVLSAPAVDRSNAIQLDHQGVIKMLQQAELERTRPPHGSVGGDGATFLFHTLARLEPEHLNGLTAALRANKSMSEGERKALLHEFLDNEQRGIDAVDEIKREMAHRAMRDAQKKSGNKGLFGKASSHAAPKVSAVPIVPSGFTVPTAVVAQQMSSAGPASTAAILAGTVADAIAAASVTDSQRYGGPRQTIEGATVVPPPPSPNYVVYRPPGVPDMPPMPPMPAEGLQDTRVLQGIFAARSVHGSTSGAQRVIEGTSEPGIGVSTGATYASSVSGRPDLFTPSSGSIHGPMVIPANGIGLFNEHTTTRGADAHDDLHNPPIFHHEDIEDSSDRPQTPRPQTAHSRRRPDVQPWTSSHHGHTGRVLSKAEQRRLRQNEERERRSVHD